MSWGRILSSQKCPVCGGRYPSSKGETPITCCKTQPTKYQLQFYWKGKTVWVVNDREGNTLDSFNRAKLALAGIRADYKNFDPEIYRKQSKTAFESFWNKFRDKYRKATYDKIRSAGIHHILPFFGNMQMRDIRAFHVDEWWTEVQNKKTAGGKGYYSPKTLNDLHEILHRFFSQAERLQIIEKAPPFPDKMKVERKHIPWLTREQQEEILKNIPKHDQRIFKFLFRSGVRVNEATGLQKSDILWGEGQIAIQHTIDRYGDLGPTKGRNSRPIPLTNPIKETLTSKVEYLSPYVFINKWGRRYSDDYLRKIYYEASDNAELPRIPLKNASRSSWGMQRLRRGIPLSKVSEGYGHSDQKMTKHYARQIAQDLVELYEDDSIINLS